MSTASIVDFMDAAKAEIRKQIGTTIPGHAEIAEQVAADLLQAQDNLAYLSTSGHDSHRVKGLEIGLTELARRHADYERGGMLPDAPRGNFDVQEAKGLKLEL